MTIANALGTKNDPTNKTLALLENANTFQKAIAVNAITLTDGATVNTDLSLGNVFKLTLSQDTTLANPTNGVAGGVYQWMIYQASFPTYAITLDTSFVKTGNVLVMNTAPASVTILTAIYDGTNYYYNFYSPSTINFTPHGTIFVATNGTNQVSLGQRNTPLADPFYATQQYIPSSQPNMMYISPGNYSVTDFAIKPQLSYYGSKITYLIVTNPITLDSTWSSAATGYSTKFFDVSINGSLSLDFSSIAVDSLVIELDNSEVTSSVSITGNDAHVLTATANLCVFSSSITLSALNSNIENCYIATNLNVQPKVSGTGVTNVKVLNSEIFGNVLVSGASGRVCTLYITNSFVVGTITVDTTNANLFIDAVSWPQGGFIFTNGATSSQITLSKTFSPTDNVYVSINGNNVTSDGSFLKPYADPFYATTQSSGTVSSPQVIEVSAGTYTTNSAFNLKPNVMYSGTIDSNIHCTNTIGLDSSWSSAAANSYSVFTDIFLNGTTTLDFSAVAVVSGIQIYDSIMASANTYNGNNSGFQQFTLQGVTYNNALTIDAALTNVYNCSVSAALTVTSTHGGNISNFYGCEFQSGVVLSGANTNAIKIRNTVITGTVAVNSSNVTVTIDDASWPSGGFTFSGGASMAGNVTVVHSGALPALATNNAFTGQNGTTPVSITSSSGSVAWNLNTAPNATHTATENTTLAAPSNQIAGNNYTLKFVQNGSSAKTFGWNTVYKFPGGVQPIVSTGLNAIDIFSFRSDGTNMLCIGVAQNIS